MSIMLEPLDIEALNAHVRSVRKYLDFLSRRVSELEKAHNRLAHYVGHATEGNTIDRDMGAKNEM